MTAAWIFVPPRSMPPRSAMPRLYPCAQGILPAADYPLMSNVSVRTQLLAGFAAVLALVVVVGALAVHELGAVGGKLDAIADGSMPRLVDIRTIDGASMDYRGVQFAYLAEPGDRSPLAGELAGRERE